jgi:hypothetical protein
MCDIPFVAMGNASSSAGEKSLLNLYRCRELLEDDGLLGFMPGCRWLTSRNQSLAVTFAGRGRRPREPAIGQAKGLLNRYEFIDHR